MARPPDTGEPLPQVGGRLLLLRGSAAGVHRGPLNGLARPVKLEWRDVAPGPAISTSLTAAETAELRRLGRNADVLEIGSAYGYSTVTLALVAKWVVAVDPHAAHGSLEI